MGERCGTRKSGVWLNSLRSNTASPDPLLLRSSLSGTRGPGAGSAAAAQGQARHGRAGAIAAPASQPGSESRQSPRSRSKPCFRSSRTAVVDQTSPMAEREAFGERASQTSSNREEQMRLLRLGEAERERAKRSGTKARCSVQLLPDPRATFFGYFLFCQKRK